MTPEVAKSIIKLPLLVIGEPVTVSLALEAGSNATLVTVPPLPLPPLPPAVLLIVILPFSSNALTVIFVPAIMLHTPELRILTTPVLALLVI